MLDRIGHVNRRSVDLGGCKRGIEQLTRGAHKRAAGKVLLVPRLLADEHHRRVEGSLAEHRLRAELVELAAGALTRILEQRLP